MASVYVVRGHRGGVNDPAETWAVKAFLDREGAESFIEQLKARYDAAVTTVPENHDAEREIQKLMHGVDRRFRADDFNFFYLEEVEAEIAEDTDLVDDVSIPPKVLSTHFIPVDRTMLQRAVPHVDVEESENDRPFDCTSRIQFRLKRSFVSPSGLPRSSKLLQSSMESRSPNGKT